jgi:hypothetical protein
MCVIDSRKMVPRTGVGSRDEAVLVTGCHRLDIEVPVQGRCIEHTIGTGNFCCVSHPVRVHFELHQELGRRPSQPAPPGQGGSRKRMWLLASNEAGSVDPPDTEGFVLAHSGVPPEKIEAYLETEYRFGEGIDVVTLRIDRRSEELARLYASSGAACGVFVTAYNPFGQARDIDTNEAAHMRLATDLRAMSARVTEGAGADPSGAWPEEKSFFALGVDLEAARQLGIRYRQDAIVWVGADAVPKLILLR